MEEYLIRIIRGLRERMLAQQNTADRL